MLKTLLDALGGRDSFPLAARILQTHVTDIERAYENPNFQWKRWPDSLVRHITLEKLQGQVWRCGSATYQVLEYSPGTQLITLQSQHNLKVRISLKHFASRFVKDDHECQQAQPVAVDAAAVPESNEHGDFA